MSFLDQMNDATKSLQEKRKEQLQDIVRYANSNYDNGKYGLLKCAKDASYKIINGKKVATYRVPVSTPVWWDGASFIEPQPFKVQMTYGTFFKRTTDYPIDHWRFVPNEKYREEYELYIKTIKNLARQDGIEVEEIVSNHYSEYGVGEDVGTSPSRFEHYIRYTMRF